MWIANTTASMMMLQQSLNGSDVTLLFEEFQTDGCCRFHLVLEKRRDLCTSGLRRTVQAYRRFWYQVFTWVSERLRRAASSMRSCTLDISVVQSSSPNSSAVDRWKQCAPFVVSYCFSVCYRSCHDHHCPMCYSLRPCRNLGRQWHFIGQLRSLVEKSLDPIESWQRQKSFWHSALAALFIDAKRKHEKRSIRV